MSLTQPPALTRGSPVAAGDSQSVLPRSLDAVSPSLVLLKEAIGMAGRPVWINADILTGPGGSNRPLDPDGFLSAVSSLPTSTVLSLGWTTGWTAGVDNPGEERPHPSATVFTPYQVAFGVVNLKCVYDAFFCYNIHKLGKT